MSDKVNFEGLKDELIKLNDDKYKDEVIINWGTEVYEDVSKHFKKLTQSQFQRFINLDIEIKNTLVEISKDNSIIELQQKVANLHKEWITLAWGKYNRDAHLGLANMYIHDVRFMKHYDKHGNGLAYILSDAIFKYI